MPYEPPISDSNRELVGIQVSEILEVITMNCFDENVSDEAFRFVVSEKLKSLIILVEDSVVDESVNSGELDNFLLDIQKPDEES